MGKETDPQFLGKEFTVVEMVADIVTKVKL